MSDDGVRLRCRVRAYAPDVDEFEVFTDGLATLTVEAALEPPILNIPPDITELSLDGGSINMAQYNSGGFAITWNFDGGEETWMSIDNDGLFEWTDEISDNDSGAVTIVANNADGLDDSTLNWESGEFETATWVYRSTGSDWAQTNAGQSISFPGQPFSIAFETLLEDRNNVNRMFAFSGTDPSSGSGFQNWRIEYRTTGNLWFTLTADTSEQETYAYSIILPLDQWIDIECGWDGANAYIEIDGNRENFAHPLFNAHSSTQLYKMLGSNSGNIIDNIQIASLSINEDNGNWQLFFPCNEGDFRIWTETLQNLDGTLTSTALHHLREGSPEGPPIWLDIDDVTILSSEVIAGWTRDMKDYVVSESDLEGWTSTGVVDINQQGIAFPLTDNPGTYPTQQTVTNEHGTTPGNEWDLEILPPNIIEVTNIAQSLVSQSIAVDIGSHYRVTAAGSKYDRVTLSDTNTDYVLVLNTDNRHTTLDLVTALTTNLEVAVEGTLTELMVQEVTLENRQPTTYVPPGQTEIVNTEDDNNVLLRNTTPATLSNFEVIDNGSGNVTVNVTSDKADSALHLSVRTTNYWLGDWGAYDPEVHWGLMMNDPAAIHHEVKRTVLGVNEFVLTGIPEDLNVHFGVVQT